MIVLVLALKRYNSTLKELQPAFSAMERFTTGSRQSRSRRSGLDRNSGSEPDEPKFVPPERPAKRASLITVLSFLRIRIIVARVMTRIEGGVLETDDIVDDVHAVRPGPPETTHALVPVANIALGLVAGLDIDQMTCTPAAGVYVMKKVPQRPEKGHTYNCAPPKNEANHYPRTSPDYMNTEGLEAVHRILPCQLCFIREVLRGNSGYHKALPEPRSIGCDVLSRKAINVESFQGCSSEVAPEYSL
ncbi:hypothetical protein FOMPIDRAFT_1017059 [Fomitopsis schrenkii]|uniref:Uncharacterized protein n=1 Tax=Fomitopsis schrenkii TaxID=2126942 RepID=S8E319_FOMSC|nr:hypothetical protein FOMPIDRAFT_1017059 [Fomitopsis schrenkii]